MPECGAISISLNFDPAVNSKAKLRSIQRFKIEIDNQIEYLSILIVDDLDTWLRRSDSR